MTDTRKAMQQPVAYLAWRDGKPCYAGEDVVCADPVWPVDALAQQGEPVAWARLNDEGLDYDMVFLSEIECRAYLGDDEAPIPLYAAAAPTAQPDARKVIEQMVVALEIAERHLAYVEITEAREAGQKWLKESK